MLIGRLGKTTLHSSIILAGGNIGPVQAAYYFDCPHILVLSSLNLIFISFLHSAEEIIWV